MWPPQDRSRHCPGESAPAHRGDGDGRSIGSVNAPVPRSGRLNPPGMPCGSTRLPLNGFTYFLTLSSKFFSTFPHGTCPLSDSCQYLALDGVYHPLWAAFPNNPTPRTLGATATPASRGLTPALGKASFKRTRASEHRRRDRPKHHISRQPEAAGFGAGLFPLHSPLLRESWLVSFPPLTNMLKFSG